MSIIAQFCFHIPKAHCLHSMHKTLSLILNALKKKTNKLISQLGIPTLLYLGVNSVVVHVAVITGV
jgi:hypothetical protein